MGIAFGSDFLWFREDNMEALAIFLAAQISTSEIPRSANYGAYCFAQGSFVSGMYKTCLYQCPNGTVSITIAAHQMCPFSIIR